MKKHGAVGRMIKALHFSSRSVRSTYLGFPVPPWPLVLFDSQTLAPVVRNLSLVSTNFTYGITHELLFDAIRDNTVRAK